MRRSRRRRLVGLVELVALPAVLLLQGLALTVLHPEAARGEVDAPPEGWHEGPVEVVRAFQPGIVQIGRDGRKIPLRIVGLDAPRRTDGRLLREALDELTEWVAESEAVLVDPHRGSNGELVGSLQLDGSDLAERLLENGFGLYEPQEGVSAGRRELLLNAQRRAAFREIGVWGLPKMETSDVTRLRGRISNVCGDAIGSQKQNDGSWLVFLGTYPNREVSIRIPPERTAAFGAPNLSFVRQEVCVKGRVVPGDPLPEVVVHDPNQIEVLGMGQSF